MVFGLCRMLLRDPLDAEDATQQVFLAAHRSITKGFTPRDPAPWLAAIARNECRARIRTRIRAPSALPLLPENLPDPVAAAVRTADLDALWRALASLPRRQRKAFLLRELGGLSYRELGVALGVTQPAVESLLFRARKRLRSALATAGAAVLPTPLRDQVARLLPAFAPSSPATATAKCAAVAVGLGLGAAGVGELPRHHVHAERTRSSGTVVVKRVPRPPVDRPSAAAAHVAAEPVALVTRVEGRSRHAARAPAEARGDSSHDRAVEGDHRPRLEHRVDRQSQPPAAEGDAADPVTSDEERPQPEQQQEGEQNQGQGEHEQPPELQEDSVALTVTEDGSGDEMTNHGDHGSGSSTDGGGGEGSDGSGGSN